MKKILVMGILTCDISMMGVDRLPAPGTALPVSRITMQCGGTAANCAMDIAKLGFPVTILGRIGSDAFGDVVMNALNNYVPLLTNHIVRDPDPLANTTTSCLCINSEGERAILTSLSATFHFNREDIPEADANSCDICFLSGALLLKAFEPAQEAAFLRDMQQSGKFTCMDTCYDTEEIWLPKIQDSIAYLDLFMPSYTEAIRLTGKRDLDEISDFFLNMGARNVVIKVGGMGAYLREGNKPGKLIPSYHYKRCVDTTGAGDSFCAGLLCGMASGNSLEESVKLGNMVGSMCISEVGGQAGLRSLEETKSLMSVCPVNHVSLSDLKEETK